MGPLRKNVLRLVYLVHICFAALLFMQPTFAKKPTRSKPLIVKTIAPPSAFVASSTRPKPHPRVAPSSSAAKPQPQAPSPAKKQAPPAAKAAKATAQTPSTPAKEPALADKVLSPSKKKMPAEREPARGKISDHLLKELEESIAKIEGKSDKTPISRQTSKTRAPIKLTVDTETSDTGEQAESYIESIVAHLHRSLTLPELGAVKIQLRLRQDGSVIKLIVLSSESKENKRYLETHLPLLHFPQFEEAYVGKKEHEFIVTFVNEI
jgi:hypothetical protein